MRARQTVRALSHRNYRIYFFGMLISFSGTWMQSVAQSWLVYRLTESAWLLGLTGFASQLPVFLVTPLAGVLADRHRRHRIVILTQVASMVQALLLAWLTLSGHVTVNAILALAVVLGIINAFDLPVRQSFLVDLVGKQDLMNAISLNSTMVNGARIIGPAVAGLIVAWLGEGPCFLINGLSYAVVIVGLLAMRISGAQAQRRKGSALSDFVEGLDYLRSTRPARAVLLLIALVSLCGLPYLVLMPIFADQVLGGGARVLGLLLGAAGVGALAGAVTLAARPSARGLGRVVALSAAAFGILLVLFSVSTNLLLSIGILVPGGFTLMLQMSGSNTLLQTMVPDRMRGRVMSFYTMSLMGIAPFGSLLAGAMATRIGAAHTVAVGGLFCLAGALLFRSQLAGLGGSEIGGSEVGDQKSEVGDQRLEIRDQIL
ncbi:MAG TPA: MFS transporter [Blastocatellia bacterium]|nr:MFS transporter [Blastocatellia bacterium]